MGVARAAAAAEYDSLENMESKPDTLPLGGEAADAHPPYGPLPGMPAPSKPGGVPLPKMLADPGEAKLGGGGRAWMREYPAARPCGRL